MQRVTEEPVAGIHPPAASPGVGRWAGLRVGRYIVAPGTLCAAGIIAIAVALRLLLSALGWPPDDGDEGTMGILALHIAYHGAHPIYFYGQAYMGTLEGYLGALFSHLFGASVFTLRLGAVLLYALFLACMYLLARLLYNTPVALIALFLLSLGTQEMLFRQVEAAGGYAETLLFGAVALLLASWLALRPPTEPKRDDVRATWLRGLAVFGWGLATGLGLWSDTLVLPFLVTSAALLLLFRRKELRSRTGLVLLAGLLLGALPVILHDLTSPLDQSIIAVTWQLSHQGGGTDPSLLAGGVLGTLTVSLPNILGATATCPIKIHDAWPISSQSLGCEVIRTGWGLGYLVLLALAAYLALRVLVPLFRRVRAAPLDEQQRHSAALHAARLALVASGLLVLAAYVVNPIAARAPWPSSRYLIGLLLTFPAVLWPIWSLRSISVPVWIGRGGQRPYDANVSAAKPTPPWRPRAAPFLRWALLLLIAFVLVRGTIGAVAGAASAAATSNPQHTLIASLERAGVTHIYTDYWNCDSIAFQTRERIICAVLNDTLAPGYNRYGPYVAAVRADPCAAYVLPAGSSMAAAFARQPPRGVAYHHTAFDGYEVYSPCRPITP